jgi:hypothetical protein
MPRPAREWQNRVRGIVKGELARRHVSYKELAERLAALGIHETEANIANKLSRGSFTAVWLVQVMDAIGSRIIRLDDGE